MVIPISNEEYFESEICMNCRHAMELPIYFFLPDHNVVELCEHCSFGLYQCTRCASMVSHLQGTPYREMVYAGPDGTFDDSYIFCRECVEIPLDETDIDYETETEQDFDDCCETETSTQILC